MTILLKPGSMYVREREREVREFFNSRFNLPLSHDISFEAWVFILFDANRLFSHVKQPWTQIRSGGGSRPRSFVGQMLPGSGIKT